MAKKTATILEVEIPYAVRKSRGIYAVNAALRKVKRAYLAAKSGALDGDQTVVFSIAARETSVPNS